MNFATTFKWGIPIKPLYIADKFENAAFSDFEPNSYVNVTLGALWRSGFFADKC